MKSALAVIVLLLVMLPARSQTMPGTSGTPPSYSHPPIGNSHWYASWCCSLRDCHPAKPGTILWRPEGWYHVPSNTLIPHGDKRIQRIPDHAPPQDKVVHHECIRQTDTETGKAGDPICIYPGRPGG